jgi:hypothetical protein
MFQYSMFKYFANAQIVKTAFLTTQAALIQIILPIFMGKISYL